MQTIVLRRGVLSDAAALVEFAARTYYETFSSVNTPENMQAYLSSTFTVPRFEAELADSRARFYLAEIQGSIVAYAKLLAGDPPECVRGEAPVELERFYVDSRWHGRGVAVNLMEKCLADARADGFKTMYLGVWEHNARAQAFYRKWNFTRVGEHIFQMGADPQVDWWMVRSL